MSPQSFRRVINQTNGIFLFSHSDVWRNISRLVRWPQGVCSPSQCSAVKRLEKPNDVLRYNSQGENSRSILQRFKYSRQSTD